MKDVAGRPREVEIRSQVLRRRQGDCCGQGHRHRHRAGQGQQAVRCVLHHQARRHGHGPSICRSIIEAHGGRIRASARRRRRGDRNNSPCRKPSAEPPARRGCRRSRRRGRRFARQERSGRVSCHGSAWNSPGMTSRTLFWPGSFWSSPTTAQHYEQSQHGNLRLRDRWRRLGRQRARQPPERGRRPPASACSRPGPRDWHPFIHLPAGFIKTFYNTRMNWCYSQEPGAWTAGRRIYRAARQDARRLQLHQRPHLQSRPAPGLRHLGAARQPRLGLRGRAALLQAPGAAHRRGRCHLSRPRRRADRHRHRLAPSAVRGLHRRRGQPRHPAQPRLQRRHAGGRRPTRSARSTRAAASAPPPRSCARPCSARMCTCARTRMRPSSCSRASARSACATPRAGAAAQPTRCARAARSSSPAAPTIRRSCCSSRASARPPLLKSLGIDGAPRAGRRRRGPAGSLRAALGRARQEHQHHQRARARPQPRRRGAEMGRSRGAASSRCRRRSSTASGIPARRRRAPTCSSPSRRRATRKASRASSRTSPA